MVSRRAHLPRRTVMLLFMTPCRSVPYEIPSGRKEEEEERGYSTPRLFASKPVVSSRPSQPNASLGGREAESGEEVPSRKPLSKERGQQRTRADKCAGVGHVVSRRETEECTVPAHLSHYPPRSSTREREERETDRLRLLRSLVSHPPDSAQRHEPASQPFRLMELKRKLYTRS